MTGAFSRFRAITTIRDGGERWRVVEVRCPCATTAVPVPPGAVVADLIADARRRHAQESPDCPHRAR